MKDLQIGWVGAGFVGQAAHLEHCINFDSCAINSLADRRPMLAKKVGKSYNIPNILQSHKDLIKSKDLDAIIAVVNRRHTFNVAKDILLSGRHLLTEKPMATHYNNAYELANIAEKKGLIYATGFMRRYDSGVRKFKSLLTDTIKSCKLGKILSVRIYVEAGSDYCGIKPRISSTEKKPAAPPVNIAPDWIPKDRQLEYENFVNVCTHDINLMRFLFQKTPKVSFVDYRFLGFSYALLDFGDFPGIFEWGIRTNDNDGWKEGLEVRFEKGQFSLELPPAFLRNVSAKVTIREDSSTTNSQSSVKVISSGYSWAFENSDLAFVKGVIDNNEPDHSGRLCLEDFLLMDEIWRHIIKR